MIIPIYPNPDYISLNDWAGRLIGDNIYDPLPPLNSEEDWKEWGDQVVSTPYLSSLNIPSPLKMEEDVTWDKWAEQVYCILFEQRIGSGQSYLK